MIGTDTQLDSLRIALIEAFDIATVELAGNNHIFFYLWRMWENTVC
jgi:hypothetical protein